MKVKASSFNTYKTSTKPDDKKKVKKQSQTPQNDIIKGILLNNYIKKDSFEKIDDFDRITTELLIPEKLEMPTQAPKEEKKETYNYKKALKPVIIASALGLAAIGAVTLATNKYSKILANTEDIVRPGDLARNINILEEPHFAAYRMLREPNTKNLAGFIGVCIMSAVTIIAKNTIDAIKEIWIKKQECDIEHELQENLIQVEADAFKGKLDVVNTLLCDTTKYFKEVLSSDEKKPTPNFKSCLSFKGDKKEQENNKKTNAKTILGIGAGILGFIGLSYGLFRNYQKTLKNLDTYVAKLEDAEIKIKIEKAINKPDKTSAIKELINLCKMINAKDETMQTNFGKIQGITQDEINSAIKEIKNSQIYAQAPEALGGISEKIQYYCYINEDRGHLYNWILNPENKFNKYLFLAFSTLSATGYIGEKSAEAMKEVIVNRENSKSELALKKRLVDVEINNFKTKKLSAINPMIESFIQQLERGKNKKDLKEMAENILIEIKNGPPYVYS